MNVRIYFETLTNLPADWETLEQKEGAKRIIGYRHIVDQETCTGNTDYFVPTAEQLAVIERLEPKENLTFIYLHTNYSRGNPPNSFRLDGLFKVIRQKDEAVIYLNEFIDQALKEGINFINE